MTRWLLPIILALGLCACSASDERAGVENRGGDTARWYDKLPRPEWQAFQRVASDEEWFEVYRIKPDIYAIYEPGQFEEVISYLILGRDRALLFDTGLGIGNIRALVERLTDLEVVVLNSHTHYDHVGGNYQFATRWGRDTEFSRARMRGLDHERVAEAVSDGWIWRPLPRGFDAESYRSRPFSYDRFVSDGMLIDLGGVSLEVLYTPGHSPDSISLLDRHRRLLFTGDTFYLAPLYTHLEGGSLSDLAASARRLRSHSSEVDQLITSHNVPVVSADYLVALDEALQAILAGSADFRMSDGAREYTFDGFSVMTTDRDHSAP